jgi:hypothetical protein
LGHRRDGRLAIEFNTVLVFVMMTETPRATATRNAGPVKSMTPLMNAPAVHTTTTKQIESSAAKLADEEINDAAMTGTVGLLPILGSGLTV